MADNTRETARRGRVGGVANALILGLVVAGTAGGIVAYRRHLSNRTPDLTGVRRAIVRRADLFVTLKAPGRVESSKRTVVECDLEDLRFNSRGSSMNAGGSSTILSLIADGTTVRKGDVLAELDSSEYEEIVRQQAIKVQEEETEVLEEKLGVDSAEAALREYRDGLLVQQREGMQGQIALAQSDIQRQEERLRWTREMAGLGYLASSKLPVEEQTLDRMKINLQQALVQLENLDKYTAPKQLLTLESNLQNHKTRYLYQLQRSKRHKDQLERFQKQVDLCTIRAPHDGFVIYANDDDDDPRIEPGTYVRQRMDLFYLPDLTDMIVETTLHESIVDRVKPGMSAQVKLEALPYLNLEGHVVSIKPLPEPENSWRQTGIKNFIGKVKLHSAPEGMLPGMTAEVELLTDRRPDVLIIPPEALAIEDGQDFCYVVAENRLQRRPIKLGEVNRSQLEVTEGLEEGEEVILEPNVLLNPGGEGRPLARVRDRMFEDALPVGVAEPAY